METVSEVLKELIGRGFEDIKIGTAMRASCQEPPSSGGLDHIGRSRVMSVWVRGR